MTERWQAAQVAELRYHMELMNPQLEHNLHRGIAGLLRLTVAEAAQKSVIDVAAGPLSLLFDYPARAGTALDPLDFGHYEAAYAEANIERIRARADADYFIPVERSRLTSPYVARQWDEVWMYNCLQHVEDPASVLANLTRWARERIRLFEWVEQPPSEVHLHSLRREEIAAVLWANGWQPAHELGGTWRERTPDHEWISQQFYAAQWIPLAVPI